MEEDEGLHWVRVLELSVQFTNYDVDNINRAVATDKECRESTKPSCPPY